MTATDRARFFAGDYPRKRKPRLRFTCHGSGPDAGGVGMSAPPRTDQRIDALLDQLAWQTHLTRTCQRVIDQLRGQVETLASVVARLEGHRNPNLARQNHLGEQ